MTDQPTDEPRGADHAHRLLDHPAPIDGDATRRQFLIGGATLAALLTGCGGATQTADPGQADGRSPVTIERGYGRTVIPTRPTRVVTVGLVEQDPLLADHRSWCPRPHGADGTLAHA